jgi:hypothetical protein
MSCCECDLVAIDDGSLTDRVIRPGGEGAQTAPADLTYAAAILNKPETRPFPERLPSVYAAQLAEWVGVLPEAAEQKAS